MTVKTLPKRSEVAQEDTWDLTTIYASEDQWEADFAAVTARMPELATYKGKLGESGSVLLEAFQLSDKLSQMTEKLYVYAHLHADEDTSNNHYQALLKRMQMLASNVNTVQSYMVPEILAIQADRLESFVATTTGLELYRHKLEELNRQRAHVRSLEVEELLSQLGEVNQGPSTIYDAWSDTDIKFPEITDDSGQKVQVGHENYSTFLISQNRQVRSDAFRAMFETFKSFQHTLTATYASRVKLNVFNSKASLYNSAREAALDSNNLPLSIYDSLISTVDANLDKLQRYLELRKRVLGLQELNCYDLYVPLVKDIDYKISFKDAQELVLNAVSVLGDEYVNILRNGFASRWVDAAENEGKASGAYSSGCWSTNPYILMSWQPTLESVFTLAHEAGHSMHSYHSRRSQPYPYANYTIFVAEVASTCNEALLAHYLLQTCKDESLRKYIINRQLEAFRTTIYRQTLFAEFEHIAHAKAEAGEPLTADTLCAVHMDLNKKYYAPAVSLDDLIRYEWARIPHFYNSFYVFKYATGLSAAIALSQQILTEGEPAVRRYLNFLSGGSSDYSINLLKGAGVDLSTPAPIQQALDVFGNSLDTFAQLF